MPRNHWRGSKIEHRVGGSSNEKAFISGLCAPSDEAERSVWGATRAFVLVIRSGHAYAWLATHTADRNASSHGDTKCDSLAASILLRATLSSTEGQLSNVYSKSQLGHSCQIQILLDYTIASECEFLFLAALKKKTPFESPRAPAGHQRTRVDGSYKYLHEFLATATLLTALLL